MASLHKRLLRFSQLKYDQAIYNKFTKALYRFAVSDSLSDTSDSHASVFINTQNYIYVHAYRHTGIHTYRCTTYVHIGLQTNIHSHCLR